MDSDFDAYRTLQIDPHAEAIVLEAAYRALARRYHPDGEAPDADRMAEINRAYDLVRSDDRRRRYDRLHAPRPMGPGPDNAAIRSVAAQAFGGRIPPPTSGHPADAGSAASSSGVIDFGRYEGWRLKDVAKQDPDYLRWLSRHSSGIRFRNEIAQLLPDETVAPRGTGY